MNTDPLALTLQNWIRRLRLQRATLWATRGFAFGLGFSLLAGGFALLRGLIVKSEFLWLANVSAAAFPILFGIAAYLWKIETLQAARRFDLQFHLEERISTALELNQMPGELAQKQREDALRHARKIRPTRRMPLRFQKIDAWLALIFTLGLAALWFRGESLFNAAAAQRQVQTALDGQKIKVEEILRAIEKKEDLSDQQKQALSEPLQQALEDLNKTNTLESAVSVLTASGEQMQAMSETQASQTMQALQQAGSSLATQEGAPLATLGQHLASGDFGSAAADLLQMDLSKMSAEELNQIASQLETLAKQIQTSNPQMAQNLKEAAQKIRAGDIAAAQQALHQAAEQMAGVAKQAAAAQAAGQAAQQLSAGAQQLLAAGGGGNAPQGQDSQAGGKNPGGAGSGAGSGDAPNSNQAGAEASTAPIPQNNGAGDGGESAYEKIYAPSLLNATGDESMGLPTSGEEGEVIGEGPVTATDGESLAPYAEVYGQYQEVNSEAIENGEVPPQFLDVVRKYFDSIQP